MSPRASRLVAFAVEHSLVLPAGAVVALIWANTLTDSYARFARSLRFAVNDIGMAFFFALVAKEVVEATAPGGALHTWRRAALPAVAATGGMIAPAVIYLAIVHLWQEPMFARGWAIPCATDIAFSALIARAIFRRHPAVPFLLLLAIADDALGLLILALFYPTGDLHLLAGGLLLAAALTLSIVLRRRVMPSDWPYIVGSGTLSWLALFHGGLHPALALVPIVPFLPHPALSRFEHRSKHLVQLVLFLFGLVNAGIELHEYGTGTWAVLIALLTGKPLGIVATVALTVAMGLHLPPSLTWRDLVVVGFAAAIGFTVALFFATAAFPVGPLLDQTKLGALLSVSGSLAALAAAAWLGVGRFARPARHP